MKIVHLLPWPTNNLIGGTELFVQNVAIEQNKFGHFVIITLPNIDNIEYWETKKNIQYFKFSNPNWINSKNISSGLECPVNIDNWFAWLDEQKPDILHIHAFEPYVYWFIQVAKQLEVKVFITPHLAQFTCITAHFLLNGKSVCDGFIDYARCTDCSILRKYESKKNMNIYVVFYKYIYTTFKIIISIIQGKRINRYFNVESKLQMLKQLNDLSDKFIVLTDDYKMKLLINNFPFDKIEVVKYNSIDSFKSKPFIRKHIFKLALIGRLSLEKGVDVLLNSLSKIDTIYYAVEVHLFGRDHDDFPSIDEQILKINNPLVCVFKHGVVEPDVLFQKLKEFDLLCIPSTVYEMSPLVIQEAFAAGIPIVGSNIGGISEYVIDNYNGLLFNLGDYKALAIALNKLINDKELYERLRNNIQVPLGFKQVANDFIKIYN